MNEAFIAHLRSKVKRGMDDAFRRGDNIQPPGVGYRLVEVKDANGNLVVTHKNTIDKAVEIDPEAAEWTRRGAEMIAYEGKSAIDGASLFNEHKVGGKQTWSDSRVRQHYGRETLYGKDVLHKTKQVVDRQLKRLTDRLAKLYDTHLDAVLAKAEEMGRQLAAKREQLKELQWAGRRPKVKSVKEKEVVAALTQLRDLLQRDAASPPRCSRCSRCSSGKSSSRSGRSRATLSPRWVARFTINAVPTLAVVGRGRAVDHDGSNVSAWGSLHDDRETTPEGSLNQGEVSVPLLRTLPRKR